MRKSAFGVAFVVLVGFAATACATTSGYLGPKPFDGPLGDVVAGNLALTCPGGYFIGPPINHCLRNLGGDFGRYGSYPIYRDGSDGSQLSETDKLSIFCGLGASGLASLLDAGLKKIIGAGLLSAASCEVAGTLLSRREESRNKPTVPGGPPPQQKQGVRWSSDGFPVAVGTRPNAEQASSVQPVIEKRSGEFTLSNSTRFKMDVYDGDTSDQANFKFRLAPGEKRGVDAPEDRYRGLALVPNIHGNISTEEFKVSPTDAGWIFVEPNVMKGR